MSAPAFLNKPKHKDNVIATSRGWVVEKTGELLVSVKNLDQRIAEHLGLPTFAFEPVTVTMAAPVVEFKDTTLPADSSLDVKVDLDTLLEGLSDAPKVTDVTELPAGASLLPVVEEAPAVVPPVPEAPVVVKKKLGRPPKIRPVEGEAAPAPAAPKAEEKPAVLEA